MANGMLHEDLSSHISRELGLPLQRRIPSEPWASTAHGGDRVCPSLFLLRDNHGSYSKDPPTKSDSLYTRHSTPLRMSPNPWRFALCHLQLLVSGTYYSVRFCEVQRNIETISGPSSPVRQLGDVITMVRWFRSLVLLLPCSPAGKPRRTDSL